MHGGPGDSISPPMIKEWIRKPFMDSERFWSFTDETSWHDSCSLSICPVCDKQQSSLALIGQPGPGKEAFQMVTEQGAAILV